MAIIGIRPQPHDSEIYRQLLLKKVELQRSLKEVSFEQITSVL